MAAYVDFEYYTDVFGGAAIPESAFTSYALRSSREVDRITRYRIQNADNPDGYPVDNKVRNAVCAVAETLFSHDQEDEKTKGGLIASETVGKHSVSFNVMAPNEIKTLRQTELRNAARGFLANTGLMYCGVGRTCGL